MTFNEANEYINNLTELFYSRKGDLQAKDLVDVLMNKVEDLLMLEAGSNIIELFQSEIKSWNIVANAEFQLFMVELLNK